MTCSRLYNHTHASFREHCAKKFSKFEKFCFKLEISTKLWRSNNDFHFWLQACCRLRIKILDLLSGPGHSIIRKVINYFAQKILRLYCLPRLSERRLLGFLLRFCLHQRWRSVSGQQQLLFCVLFVREMWWAQQSAMLRSIKH